MMEVIRGHTADDVWRQAYRSVMAATRSGTSQPSRAGDTYEVLHVALEIEDPRERWVVARRPALNPAFCIAEVIWILAGSNDSAVLNYWFPDLPSFAGVGPTYPGAYGYRLRHQFGVDQLRRACEALTANRHSRQVVLQLWDVRTDLPDYDGTPRNDDIPCNVVALLKVRDGHLEWTQIMRSNDLHRGLPYNFFQFTMLQEVMAGWLTVQLGHYYHWSDSLHVYCNAAADFSCEAAMILAANSDSLATDVGQGEKLIAELYGRLVELTAPNVSESHLIDLATMPDAPIGYQNLLRVLGAESARRRVRFDQSEALMSACTNRQLAQVWAAWWQRVRKPRT